MQTQRPAMIRQDLAAATTGLALAMLASACSIDPPSVTPFPMPVDRSTGAILTPVDVGGGTPLLTAAVDIMSPITVIDTSIEGQPVPAPEKRVIEMALTAMVDTGAGLTPVPRTRFPGVDSLDLHMCPSPEINRVSPCRIGIDDQNEIVRGVVGADVLARNAVRFLFGRSEMQFLPDIAGSNEERGALCDAVFSSPFYGGGTMIVGGAEVSFSGRRLALGACFVAEEAPGCPISYQTGPDQGVDGLFVVSTGVPITLVTETTYAQYRRLHPTTPRLDLLPEATVHLASGPVQAHLGSMENLALVGEESDTRGPCSERYANDYLTRARSCDAAFPERCPCSDDRSFCRTAAVLEIWSPFAVAVVPDGEPIIQSLRDELRPDLPEVSGILGANALGAAVLELDYPNNRVLARCADPQTCHERPAVVTSGALDGTNRACAARLPDPACPPPVVE